MSLTRLLLATAVSTAAFAAAAQAEPTVRFVANATTTILSNPSQAVPPSTPSLAASDGYLYGITPASGNQGGSLFRVAPGGTVLLLHRFPAIASGGKKNVGGYRPVGKPVLALDGFLYGITFQGGAFGQGVLYRVRPDGKEYATVVDLDGRLLPDGSYQVQPAGDASLLTQDADGHFYFTTTAGGLVRVEGNGLLTLVYHKSNVFKILPGADPASAPVPEIAVVSETDGIVTVDQVRVTDGTVLSSYSSPAGAFPNGLAIPLQVVKAGLLLQVGVNNVPGVSAHVTLLAPDGSLKVIGVTLESQTPALNFYNRFLYAEDDGTFYFSAGTSTTLGTTILQFSPNGSQKIVAGAPAGFASLLVAGPGASYYGATNSSAIYVPHDGQASWSPTWMDSSNSASYDVVKAPRKGANVFQISPQGDALYSNPLAQIDVVSSRGKASVTIPVLKNDKAPVGGQLRLTGADSLNGTATVSGSSVSFVSDRGGDFSSQVNYTVDAGPDASGESTGAALVRGAIAGTFTDPAVLVRKAPLTFRVSANGRFTATVPDGTGKFAPLSGLLDYHDMGVAILIPKIGETIRLQVALDSDGDQRGLYYTLIDADGGSIGGVAHLK